jgi:adenosylhomocysteinase
MSTVAVNCDIKNVELADLGKKRIEWANQSMKVLQIIRKEFIKNQPLKGIRVSACLHVTAETANLGICLRDGGAEVVLCASNPLSTQDDVAASLVRDHNIPVYAIKGEDNDTYYNHIQARSTTAARTMDDGADLVTIHTKRTDALTDVISNTEGRSIIRLRAMAKEGVLKFRSSRSMTPTRIFLIIVTEQVSHHRQHHPRHGYCWPVQKFVVASYVVAADRFRAWRWAEVIITEISHQHWRP